MYYIFIFSIYISLLTGYSFGVLKENAFPQNKANTDQLYKKWKQKNKRRTNTELLKVFFDFEAKKQASQPGHLIANAQLKTLYAYNFLRERLHLSSAENLKAIDKVWIESNGYQIWKSERKVREFKDIMKWLDRIKTAQNKNQRILLYNYNFLRESLKLEPTERIDKKWLDRLNEKIIPYTVMLEKNFDFATPSQQQLLHRHKNILGIKDNIVPLSHDTDFGAHALHISRNGKSQYLIAMSKTPNYNYRLFALYHEFAHIVNRDPLSSHVKNKNKKDEDFLKDPDFVSDLKTIDYYLKLGKKAFDTSHKLGRTIHKILSKNPVLWQTNSLKNYNEVLVKRGFEKRADLFAITKLYEQNFIDPILEIIRVWATSEYIVALNDEDDHPSDFERALYIAGFLASKKIDVNAALRKFEKQGIVDAERVYLQSPKQTFSVTKIEKQLITAYQAWKKNTR